MLLFGDGGQQGGGGHPVRHHLSSHALGANRPAVAQFYPQVLQEEFGARLSGSGPLLVMLLLLNYEMTVLGLPPSWVCEDRSPTGPQTRRCCRSTLDRSAMLFLYGESC